MAEPCGALSLGSSTTHLQQLRNPQPPPVPQRPSPSAPQIDPTLAATPIREHCTNLAKSTVPTARHGDEPKCVCTYPGQPLVMRKVDRFYSINVNDPGLITLVNKLQDVFTTVGVCAFLPPMAARLRQASRSSNHVLMPTLGSKPYRSTPDCCRRIAIQRKVVRAREYCRSRLVSPCDCTCRFCIRQRAR